jgi:hypothetical protein
MSSSTRFATIDFSMISTVQDHGYVFKKGTALVPSLHEVSTPNEIAQYALIHTRARWTPRGACSMGTRGGAHREPRY